MNHWPLDYQLRLRCGFGSIEGLCTFLLGVRTLLGLLGSIVRTPYRSRFGSGGNYLVKKSSNWPGLNFSLRHFTLIVHTSNLFYKRFLC